MADWTQERHDGLRAHVDGTRLSGGAFEMSEGDAADMLDKIEQLKSALETMTGQRNAFRDHLGIAEARLRRYEGHGMAYAD